LFPAAILSFISSSILLPLFTTERKGKGEGKVHLITCHENPEGE
jgi:hypothetical protein